MNRRSIVKLLGLAWPATGAFAQPSLKRGVRLIVPLGPGSVSDDVARLVGPHLSTSLGQTVVVENKAGANGIIGMQELMRSPPDGSSLLIGSVSPLAINVALMKSLPYDPRRDVTPITGLYSAHHMLMVRSNHPARTLAEFIAYVKQRPGQVSIGYPSTLVHSQILALNKMAGIELLAVPYKSTASTFTDALGGTLEAALTDYPTVWPHVKSGAARVLSVSSLKRNPVAPDVPAVSETLPGFDFSSWSALVGPPGMSRELVNLFNVAAVNAVRQKDVADKFAQSGMSAWTTTPAELKTFIDAQVARWNKLAADLNLERQ